MAAMSPASLKHLTDHQAPVCGWFTEGFWAVAVGVAGTLRPAWRCCSIAIIVGKLGSNTCSAGQLIAENDPHIDQSIAHALLANDRYPEAIAEARLAMGEWPPEGGLWA
jgi:hypothetical protein